MNNVTIKNDITATIVNKSTNSLVINLLENTTNILSDGGSSEYDGCIYSLGALTIEGSGELYVYGNQVEGEGIATETNDITISYGNIYIKANGDGIDSNKNLIINGGYIYTMGSTTGGDAGIDTDDGLSINGGTVIALGAGMLETPKSSSTQNSVYFNLSNKISEGTTIELKNENDEEIISFETEEGFTTLIISNDKITNGTYYLYQNGEKTSYTAMVK